MECAALADLSLARTSSTNRPASLAPGACGGSPWPGVTSSMEGRAQASSSCSSDPFRSSGARGGFDRGCRGAINEATASSAFVNQNQPNPFSFETTIDYSLNTSGSYVFEVTNVAGKIIHEKNLGLKHKGNYSIKFQSNNLAPGIYFYSLINNKRRITKKMIIQ